MQWNSKEAMENEDTAYLYLRQKDRKITPRYSLWQMNVYRSMHRKEKKSLEGYAKRFNIIPKH